MPYNKETNILKIHDYYHSLKNRLSKLYVRLFPEQHNFSYFLFSFIMASFLWHGINGGEKVLEQYDVRVNIDYRNLPAGLTIRERTDTIFVRIRGTVEDFKELDRRELVYNMDLSEIDRGANMLALETNDVKSLNNFEIISTNPSHILIITENYREKVVELEALVSKKQLAHGFNLSDVKLFPSHVIIRGGESQLAGIEKINVPLNIGKDEKAGVYRQSVAVQMRTGIESEPPIVEVSYRLEPQMQEIELERDIHAFSYQKNGYKPTNTKAIIKMYCPVSLVGEKDLYEQVTVYKEPLAIAGRNDRLRAILPIEFRLIEIQEKYK